MKIDQIYRLAERLGMKQELKPLFDSDSRAYGRFEKTILKILENIGRRRNCPIVRSKKGYESIGNFSEALVNFEDNYGLGTKRKTQRQIGEETTRLEEDIFGDKKVIKYTGSAIYERINFVTQFLKQNHKKEIWYGTL